MGINCPTVPLDINFIGNSNNGFHPNQGFNAGWNKPSFLFDNCKHGGMGQNFNRSEPSLRDIIRDKVRINDEVGKKIHSADNLLENINAKMDKFIVAMQNQLSFNKMLETQIQQIFAAIPSQGNGDSLRTPVQESVRSIFSVFKKSLQNLLKDLWEQSVRIRSPTQPRIFCRNFLDASRMPRLLQQVLQLRQ
jgi:hypothetical protein